MSVDKILNDEWDESSDSFFDGMKFSSPHKSAKSTVTLDLHTDLPSTRKITFNDTDEIFQFKERTPILDKDPLGIFKKPSKVNKLNNNSQSADLTDILFENEANLQKVCMLSSNQECLTNLTQKAKRYENILLKTQNDRQDVCKKQEKLFEDFLKQQSVKQKLIEENVQKQQEKINSYLESMITVSGKEPYFDDKEIYSKSFLDKLNKIHDDEVTLLDLSYGNQIDVLKNFIDSHQLLFKAEIEELKKFYDNQINCMRQNYFNNLSDMKNEYEQVINQLKECKDLDSLENLVAKLDSNFNEIAQIKTTSNDLLCDFKETKQDLLQNQLHFSQWMKQQIEGLYEKSRTQNETVEGVGSILRDVIREFNSEKTSVRSTLDNINNKLLHFQKERECHLNEIHYEKDFLKKLWDKLHDEQTNFKEKMSEEWATIQDEKTRLDVMKKIGVTDLSSERKSAEADIMIQTAQNIIETNQCELKNLLSEKEQISVMWKHMQQQEERLKQRERDLNGKQNELDKKLVDLKETEKRNQNLLDENMKKLQMLSQEKNDLNVCQLFVAREKLEMYDSLKGYKRHDKEPTSDTTAEKVFLNFETIWQGIRKTFGHRQNLPNKITEK